MCQILEIHPSGFYVWLKQPESKRAIEDKRLLGQIKQFWTESGFSYGYRNITLDMKDHGGACGKNRVHRIMREACIYSHILSCSIIQADAMETLAGYRRWSSKGSIMRSY